mgnify:CR=1 FL=1
MMNDYTAAGNILPSKSNKLFYFYNVDKFDETGLNEATQLDRNHYIEYDYVLHSDLIRRQQDFNKTGYGFIPMKRIQLDIVELMDIMSTVGGFWTAINSVTFIFISYVLFE